MADEINRASPRTQSALLQAMQEHHVTVAGERHDLPRPFHVLATQNPIEQEGTYPLPEAQLDRFLLADRRRLSRPRGRAPHPARDHRRRHEHEAAAAMTAEELMAAQRLVRRLPVGESVVEAILDLVRSARPGEGGDPAITEQARLGPRPARRQALMLAVRARALIEGRARALRRRCRRPRRARAEAPHGADLRRARRGRDRRRASSPGSWQHGSG